MELTPMAQPVHPDPGLTGAPPPDLFHDEAGYFRSPVDAAAYAIIASGGQGFTTPAREARRMLTSPDPRYQAIARNWLAVSRLPEVGDIEPSGWQNWYAEWLGQHPEAVASPPLLHAVPALPPEPPKKVTVQVVPGSRLESLLSQWDEARAMEEEARKRKESLKAGITAELTEQHQGTGAFDIPGTPGRLPLSLRHTAPRMFSAKEFKADRPDLYEQYRRPSPRWTLGVPQQKGGGQ